MSRGALEITIDVVRLSRPGIRRDDVLRILPLGVRPRSRPRAMHVCSTRRVSRVRRDRAEKLEVLAFREIALLAMVGAVLNVKGPHGIIIRTSCSQTPRVKKFDHRSLRCRPRRKIIIPPLRLRTCPRSRCPPRPSGMSPNRRTCHLPRRDPTSL